MTFETPGTKMSYFDYHQHKASLYNHCNLTNLISLCSWLLKFKILILILTYFVEEYENKDQKYILISDEYFVFFTKPDFVAKI